MGLVVGGWREGLRADRWGTDLPRRLWFGRWRALSDGLPGVNTGQAVGLLARRSAVHLIDQQVLRHGRQRG